MSPITHSAASSYLQLDLDARLKDYQKALEGTDAEAIVKTAMAYKKARDLLQPPKVPTFRRQYPLERFTFPVSLPPKSKNIYRIKADRPLEGFMDRAEFQKHEIGLCEQTLYAIQALIFSLMALGALSIICKEINPPHK